MVLSAPPMLFLSSKFMVYDKLLFHIITFSGFLSYVFLREIEAIIRDLFIKVFVHAYCGTCVKKR